MVPRYKWLAETETMMDIYKFHTFQIKISCLLKDKGWKGKAVTRAVPLTSKGHLNLRTRPLKKKSRFSVTKPGTDDHSAVEPVLSRSPSLSVFDQTFFWKTRTWDLILFYFKYLKLATTIPNDENSSQSRELLCWYFKSRYSLWAF